MSTDKRRFRPIEVRQRGSNVHLLLIDRVVWAEVEWSPSRRAFCVQDAAGHCLTHVEHIHATAGDPQEAVRLARKMIMDGRMPTPEQAEAQLRERRAAEDTALPAGADDLRGRSLDPTRNPAIA